MLQAAKKALNAGVIIENHEEEVLLGVLAEVGQGPENAIQDAMQVIIEIVTMEAVGDIIVI